MLKSTEHEFNEIEQFLVFHLKTHSYEFIALFFHVQIYGQKTYDLKVTNLGCLGGSVG